MERSLLPGLLLLVSTGFGKAALLDLTGEREIEGTWRAPVCLPCVYEPSADFKQESVSWKASLTDHGLRTLFRRDPTSGDQTLLTHFKSRIRVPKAPPGDVSLQIEELEMGDRGQYTCEVVWVSRNKSRVTKQKMIVLNVIKVAVTKPVITAGSTGSIVPRGRNTSLTCHTNGSPPIIYRWFKAAQGGNEDKVGQNAILHFDSLNVSDTGTYFCEVENRVSSAVQRSNAFQLTVKDPSEFPSLRPGSENTDTTIAERDPLPTSLEPWRDSSIPEHHIVNPAPHATSLPLHIILLIAMLCVGVLLAVLAVIFCRRKPKPDHTYDVTYNNSVTVTREETSPDVARTSRCEPEQVPPRSENNYTLEPTGISEYVLMGTKLDNEYEVLVQKMESEYEVVNTVNTE